MNLHSMVSGIVGIVNPSVIASLQRSNGSTKGVDFKRTPTYSSAENITVQEQPLSNDELQQISGLNIQGEKKGFYANGRLKAVSRDDATGGDLLTLPDGTLWLVVHELENWSSTSGWCKVAVTRQLS